METTPALIMNDITNKRNVVGVAETMEVHGSKGTILIDIQRQAALRSITR